MLAPDTNPASVFAYCGVQYMQSFLVLKITLAKMPTIFASIPNQANCCSWIMITALLLILLRLSGILYTMNHTLRFSFFGSRIASDSYHQTARSFGTALRRRRRHVLVEALVPPLHSTLLLEYSTQPRLRRQQGGGVDDRVNPALPSLSCVFHVYANKVQARFLISK